MPYIERSATHEVIALFLQAPQPSAEWLSLDHPDVLAFLARSDDRGAAGLPHEVLATLDRAMIRVLEDLVDVLVDKQIIQLSDLPEKARYKVMARKEFRSALPAGPMDAERSGLDDIV